MITPRQKPILKTPVKARRGFPGLFLPPIPFYRQGGRIGAKARGKRRGKKAFTAWNVNTKQVGSFLRGPTYKKSRSTIVFDDLDKRTKKAKKEKDYDYLDFF